MSRDFVNPEDRDIFAGCIKKIEETGGLNGPVAIKMNRRDGADVYVEWIGTAFMQKEKATVLLIGRDVTARKCAEDQFKESEERYRVAIESSNDGVTILKGDSYLYVNRKFVEMFGFKNINEILGKHISLILHPDDRERVVEINGKRQRGEDVPSRYEFRAPVGNVPVVVGEKGWNGTWYNPDGTYCVLQVRNEHEGLSLPGLRAIKS